LLEATPAESDQQQLPSVVWNVPQIADRQRALAGLGPSPLPQLIEGIEKLNQAGASHIVIPCNTAHHWYDALSAVSQAPILHIVDATLEAIAQQSVPAQRVGIIATKGTLDAGWYQARLRAGNRAVYEPTAQELEQWFVPGCYAVKRGDLQQGGALLTQQAQALLSRGAELLILACTEVPVALQAVNAPFQSISLDPAQALAERCSSLWQAHRAIH